MDPVTLATAVTALLVPALSNVAQTAVTQAEQHMPEYVSQLWSSILAHFKDKPAAEDSVHELQANAADIDNQEAFAVQLKKLLKTDPAFAVELENLFHGAQVASGLSNTGSGGVAAQGSVASGADGIAVGGNVGGNIILGNYNRVNDRPAAPQ